MKVLLVNGSPHADGCTNRALTEIQTVLLECGIDSEIYWIGKESIGGCTACLACKSIKKCAIDDKVNDFVNKAHDFDGFIFGSPVYYAGANGSLISFMDRVFYSARSAGLKCFDHKPAAAIASARRAGTTPTLDTVNRFFGLYSMPIITSTYWNEVHGGNALEVVEDGEGMRTMRNLARNMAWFLKLKAAGESAGITPPELEKRPYTNFIR